MMNYSKLAVEMMHSMQRFFTAKKQKRVNEGLRGEAFILDFIESKKGEVMPGEIGCAMNISSARIASALNNLESKGLVTREIDPSDRRRILVNLTPRGRETTAKKKCQMLEEMTQMLTLLGEKDALEYVRLTKKLAELISNED